MLLDLHYESFTQRLYESGSSEVQKLKKSNLTTQYQIFGVNFFQSQKLLNNRFIDFFVFGMHIEARTLHFNTHWQREREIRARIHKFFCIFLIDMSPLLQKLTVSFLYLTDGNIFILFVMCHSNPWDLNLYNLYYIYSKRKSSGIFCKINEKSLLKNDRIQIVIFAWDFDISRLNFHIWL